MSIFHWLSVNMTQDRIANSVMYFRMFTRLDDLSHQPHGNVSEQEFLKHKLAFRKAWSSVTCLFVQCTIVGHLSSTPDVGMWLMMLVNLVPVLHKPMDDMWQFCFTTCTESYAIYLISLNISTGGLWCLCHSLIQLYSSVWLSQSGFPSQCHRKGMHRPDKHWNSSNWHCHFSGNKNAWPEAWDLCSLCVKDLHLLLLL